MIDRFPTESNFQGDISKEFLPLSLSLSESLFQLSVLPRTLHVAEYFLLYSLIPSTCPGVLRGELHSCWNKYFKLYPRSKSMTVSTTVLTIILRTHHCILS